MGLGHLDPVKVQKMDSTDGMDEMREVGRAVAERRLKPSISRASLRRVRRLRNGAGGSSGGTADRRG